MEYLHLNLFDHIRQWYCQYPIIKDVRFVILQLYADLLTAAVRCNQQLISGIICKHCNASPAITCLAFYKIYEKCQECKTMYNYVPGSHLACYTHKCPTGFCNNIDCISHSCKYCNNNIYYAEKIMCQLHNRLGINELTKNITIINNIPTYTSLDTFYYSRIGNSYIVITPKTCYFSGPANIYTQDKDICVLVPPMEQCKFLHKRSLYGPMLPLDLSDYYEMFNFIRSRKWYSFNTCLKHSMSLDGFTKCRYYSEEYNNYEDMFCNHVTCQSLTKKVITYDAEQILDRFKKFIGGKPLEVKPHCSECLTGCSACLLPPGSC